MHPLVLPEVWALPNRLLSTSITAIVKTAIARIIASDPHSSIPTLTALEIGDIDWTVVAFDVVCGVVVVRIVVVTDGGLIRVGDLFADAAFHKRDVVLG